MVSGVEMCSVCAWRATCNKKFNLSGRDLHCPDFSEDISIKSKTEDTGTDETEGGEDI